MLFGGPYDPQVRHEVGEQRHRRSLPRLGKLSGSVGFRSLEATRVSVLEYRVWGFPFPPKNPGKEAYRCRPFRVQGVRAGGSMGFKGFGFRASAFGGKASGFLCV